MLSTLSDLTSEKKHEKTESKLANIQLFVVRLFFFFFFFLSKVAIQTKD